MITPLVPCAFAHWLCCYVKGEFWPEATQFRPQMTLQLKLHKLLDSFKLPILPILPILLACVNAAAFAAETPTSIPANPSAPAALEGRKLDTEAALRISQAAIGTTPADYTLLDRQGKPVRLSSFRGKPLLVSFIYTGCFQVCPTNTRSLYEAVQALQKLVGHNKFNVVSIGFNQPYDTPQAMRSFAAQHAINAVNWEFLSPHASIVTALTRDFAANLRKRIAAGQTISDAKMDEAPVAQRDNAPAPAANAASITTPEEARPLNAGRLFWRMLWERIGGWFKRAPL